MGWTWETRLRDEQVRDTSLGGDTGPQPQGDGVGLGWGSKALGESHPENTTLMLALQLKWIPCLQDHPPESCLPLPTHGRVWGPRGTPEPWSIPGHLPESPDLLQEGEECFQRLCLGNGRPGALLP